MQRAGFAGLPLVRVDQVGDLGEGKEGNADRQDDFLELKTRAGQRIQRIDEEVRILVVAEQAEVECDGGDQQKEIARVPVAVEKQRRQSQPARGERGPSARRENEKQERRYGKEN